MTLNGLTRFTTEITEITEKTFRFCSVCSAPSVVDVKLIHKPLPSKARLRTLRIVGVRVDPGGDRHGIVHHVMMRNRWLSSGLAALAAALVVAAAGPLVSSQTRAGRPRVIAVRAGRLFDAKSTMLSANQIVLIEGDRIAAVGPDVKIPGDATVLDFTRATVLPGMIDTHVHLYDQPDGRSPSYRTLVAAQNARKTLEAGFTTAVDLDSRGGYGTVDIREAINKGVIAGPRLQVSGPVAEPARRHAGRVVHRRLR